MVKDKSDLRTPEKAQGKTGCLQSMLGEIGWQQYSLGVVYHTAESADHKKSRKALRYGLTNDSCGNDTVPIVSPESKFWT